MNTTSMRPGTRCLMSTIAAAGLTAAVASCGSADKSPGADAGGWVTLSDDPTLEHWVQRGGKAAYRFEDGVIVGSSRPNQPNSFLCTKRDYGDFELEFEFKVDPELNSGVQFRSLSLPEYRNGVVHGYQYEIDPTDRAYSGGIYDEGRRGTWVANPADNPQARAAFKQNEWNSGRVLAVGDHLQTWINGVRAVDVHDSMTASGFIGLQVHGVGDRTDPLEVRWRNIRIREITPKPFADEK